MTILLLDHYNLFFRNFMMSPQTNENGDHVGGLVGYLKSLNFLIKSIRPNKIIICGDGKNLWRKKLYKEYKENRAKDVKSLNRFLKESITIEQVEANKKWQLGKIRSYIDLFPISYIEFDELEADDLIAIVARFPHLRNCPPPISGSVCNKVIVSTDQDFYQLLSITGVEIYSPTKHEYVRLSNVIERFGVHPNNFALAKAIVGDDSDNIVGIRGFGFKTVSKLFPQLAEEQKHNVSDIIKLSQENTKKSKKYIAIVANEALLNLNHDIINFDYEFANKSLYMAQIAEEINIKKELYAASIRVKLIEDQIVSLFDVDELILNLMHLDKANKND